MLAIDDFEALKRKVAAAARARDEAAGRLAALADRLQSEFGAASPKHARAMLAELVDREHALFAEYAAARQEFLDTWSHVLDGEPNVRPTPDPETDRRRPPG